MCYMFSNFENVVDFRDFTSGELSSTYLFGEIHYLTRKRSKTQQKKEAKLNKKHLRTYCRANGK